MQTGWRVSLAGIRLGSLACIKMGLGDRDQQALLHPLFVKRASVAATLRTNVRTTLAFLAWADAAGIDPWTISAERIALYLRDASSRGTSVPKSLWSSLDWARDVFELQWFK